MFYRYWFLRFSHLFAYRGTFWSVYIIRSHGNTNPKRHVVNKMQLFSPVSTINYILVDSFVLGLRQKSQRGVSQNPDQKFHHKFILVTLLQCKQQRSGVFSLFSSFPTEFILYLCLFIIAQPFYHLTSLYSVYDRKLIWLGIGKCLPYLPKKK